MLWNLSFQCSWMDFVEESFYLWHSDITSAARHYLIWAYPPLRLSYLSAVWPCTIWCPYMEIIRHPWAMRSLLKEQTFFERMGEFPEKRREEPRMPSHFPVILYTTVSGGRKFSRAARQIFGKSFVHRSDQDHSWENPLQLTFKKILDHLKQHPVY